MKLSEEQAKLGWLNLLNAELSPRRYWRGPGSQEFGVKREKTTHYDSCIKTGSFKSHFNVSLIVRGWGGKGCGVRGKVEKPVSINHKF